MFVIFWGFVPHFFSTIVASNAYCFTIDWGIVCNGLQPDSRTASVYLLSLCEASFQCLHMFALKSIFYQAGAIVGSVGSVGLCWAGACRLAASALFMQTFARMQQGQCLRHVYNVSCFLLPACVLVCLRACVLAVSL